MKTLPESVEIINKRLIDYFGLFENNQANWKLVWSEDELEKREMTHTDSGIELMFPEVREVKKFGYIKNRWVLTRLLPVPFINERELAGEKLSYEPIWTFEDVLQNPTVPTWGAIQVIINTINEQISRVTTPIKKPTVAESNDVEGIKYRADKLYEQLYGDETSITDALSRDSAVGYGIRNRK